MDDDTYSGNVQTLPQRPGMNGMVSGDAVPVRDSRGDDITNRTPWIDMPQPFDNLEVRVWLDYPSEIADLLTKPENEIQEQASARVMEFLKSVILDHRGAAGGRWRQNGEALPSPETDAFWEAIPTPLGRAISERFFEELQGNPTSRALRRQKLKRSRRR